MSVKDAMFCQFVFSDLEQSAEIYVALIKEKQC